MKDSETSKWTEVRGRIAKVHAAGEKGDATAPERERQILKARAKELAREPRDAEVEADWIHAVEFELAGESYALPLDQVQEVCLLKELTLVPCTPPFVLGIINLRGEIRTVIDLKKFFELPDAGITDGNKILLIGNDEMRLGLLADSIRSVRRVRLADMQPALPTMTGIRSEYLRGVTSDRIVMLDAGKILADPRILVDDKDQA